MEVDQGDMVMSHRFIVVLAMLMLSILSPAAAQAAWVWSGEEVESFTGSVRVMSDSQASRGRTAGLLWNGTIGGQVKVTSNTVNWIYLGAKGSTCSYVGPKLRVNVWQWRPLASGKYDWEQITSNKEIAVATLASGSRTANASVQALPGVGYGFQSFQVNGARAGFPYYYVQISMLNDVFSDSCDRNAFVDTVWMAGWQ